VPRCVDICPTQAMKFGDEEEFAAEIEAAKAAGTLSQLEDAETTKPRVYYLNVPKRFIGGLLYDPKAKEIIKGANLTLTDTASGEKRTTQTDGFGDFWFEGLEEGRTFSLAIEAEGFAAKTYDKLDTTQDVNLGEIALGR